MTESPFSETLHTAQLHNIREERKIIVTENLVERPSGPWTETVHRFLDFCWENGFHKVPRGVSFDEEKERVTFVNGEVWQDPLPDVFYKEDIVREAALLLRDFHHVSEKYLEHLKGNELWMLPITDRIEVICHGDFAPYNVTFIDDRPLFDRIITRLKQLITFMRVQASKGDRQFQQDIMEGHLDIYEKDILFLLEMRAKIESGIKNSHC